jgi:hypothetical protein
MKKDKAVQKSMVDHRKGSFKDSFLELKLILKIRTISEKKTQKLGNDYNRGNS